MENRIPKNRYNGGTTIETDKRTAATDDRLKAIGTVLDKHAAGIAQTVTDVFKFMSLTAAMLPNMDLDTGVFRLKIDDDGVFFALTYPGGRKNKERENDGISDQAPDNYDDEEEGLLYDGD